MAQTREGALKCSINKFGITIDEYIAHKDAQEKRCSKCKTWKYVELFPNNSGPPNTISGTCLECSRVIHKKSTKGRISTFKGKQHSCYAKTRMAEAHRGSNNHRWKGGVSYRETPRDMSHTLAKRAVNHAIEAGRIAKVSLLPCFDCGQPATEYHHYKGYERSQWFDIQALCRSCHRARHSVES